MTEQNTLTTENEVERIVEEFEKHFLDKWLPPAIDIATLDGDSRSMRERGKDWLRTILTPLIEDRNARAREVVEEMKGIAQTNFDYYQGEKKVINEHVLCFLEDYEKTLSHGIDLSSKE